MEGFAPKPPFQSRDGRFRMERPSRRTGSFFKKSLQKEFVVVYYTSMARYAMSGRWPSLSGEFSQSMSIYKPGDVKNCCT
jgi:hypothetical protein